MNNKIQNIIGKIQLGAKRNAPELLLGAAIVTGTACVVTAGRASIEAKKRHARLMEDKESLEYLIANGGISDEESANQVRKMYSKYALDLAKEFAIPAGLYATTVAAVFASYKIQKNRQLALSAALTACTTAYATLYNKLKNGAKHGLTAKEVMDGVEVRETVDAETGEITTEKVQGEAVNGLYEFRFDRYSTAWEKDKFQNECTLKSLENWANDMLNLRGYIFLNEVLERLGLRIVPYGQLVGWTKDGDGDGYVDFGVTDCSSLDSVKFDHNAFDLNFNVDGDILSKF